MATKRLPLFLLAGLSCPAILEAQLANEMSLPTTTLAPGSRASLLVRCSHQPTLSGFSLSIRYPPEVLLVREVVLTDTSLGRPPAEILYWSGKVGSGQIVQGAALSAASAPTHYLPPASDHTLARLEVDVLAPAGAVGPLEFVDGLGSSYPISNLLVDEEGHAFHPALKNGSITVVPLATLPPVADAGPDQAAAELSLVSLDGSGSSSPAGRTLTYRWSQLSGPAARAAGALNQPQAYFVLPGVSGDARLLFDLSVSDGLLSTMDQVEVTVPDLALRRAQVRKPLGAAARLLDGGRRAVVFQGDVVWDTPGEDGFWSSARFAARGAGDESVLLSGAWLYVDANANGDFDGGDRRLGGPIAVPSDNEPVSFGFFQRLKAAVPTRFFLVVDVSAAALAGVTGELRFDILDQDSLTLRSASFGLPPAVSGLPLPGLPLLLGGLFRRGDANGDGRSDISDAIYLLSWQFNAGTGPGCSDAADCNDDARTDISDAVLLLQYQFLGGIPPAAPFPNCGSDPSPDALPCVYDSARC